VRHHILEKSRFHGLLQVYVPRRASVGHNDDGGRYLAPTDEVIDGALQLSFDRPVISRAAVAVQQIQDGVAQVAAFLIAVGQVDVVCPGAFERGAMELGGLDDGVRVDGVGKQHGDGKPGSKHGARKVAGTNHGAPPYLLRQYISNRADFYDRNVRTHLKSI